MYTCGTKLQLAISLVLCITFVCIWLIQSRRGGHKPRQQQVYVYIIIAHNPAVSMIAWCSVGSFELLNGPCEIINTKGVSKSSHHNKERAWLTIHNPKPDSDYSIYYAMSAYMQTWHQCVQNITMPVAVRQRCITASMFLIQEQMDCRLHAYWWSKHSCVCSDVLLHHICCFKSFVKVSSIDMEIMLTEPSCVAK